MTMLEDKDHTYTKQKSKITELHKDPDLQYREMLLKERYHKQEVP